MPLESLQMDCKKFPGWRADQKVNCLGIICEGSHPHRPIPVKDRADPQCVREAYRTGWKRWLGAPPCLLLDAAAWNTGPAMPSGCSRDGTYIRVAPGEAHHQMGLIESMVT